MDTPRPRSDTAPREKRDRSTHIGGLGRVPHLELPEMRRIYRRLVELATREAPRPELDAGYRLAWGRDDEHGWRDLSAEPGAFAACCESTRRWSLLWRDLSAEPGAFAVIGRHSLADVVLAHDEELSLRHLLATVYPLPRVDGGRADVGLRLLDLRATVPVLLEDGTARRSIVATGPVCVRLGSYVLAAFPIHEGNLEIAGSATLDSPDLPQSAVRAELLPPQRTSRALHTSEISVLPQASDISQIIARQGTAEPRGARLTIERDGRETTVSLTESELANGVLVGRGEKCLDAATRALLTGRISRVHLIVLAEGARVTAYDLCTMNGTRRGDERVRATTLDDDGTRLLLGSRRDGVYLRWQRSPQPAPADSYL